MSREGVAPSPHRTFRDPSGSVQVHADGVIRQVNSSHAADLLEFLGLPLATSMVKSGRMVASEVIACSGGNFELRHPRVPFISYPWEWCPAMWLAAADVTLDLCDELIEEGWILKDATPLNVLFSGGNPVFVDVASVERLDVSRPVWMAYSQFVRTFLLPMLAYSELGWPLQTAQIRRDGFEPEDLYAALPVARRFGRMLMPVTLPTWLNRKPASGKKSAGSRGFASRLNDPDTTKKILRRHISNLRKAMHRAMPKRRESTWSGYAETAAHYSQGDHDEKRRFVSSTLEAYRPGALLDVGCNTGTYSRIAAERGARVVAIDTDVWALERLALSVKGTALNILPLRVDLAYPTPALGWNNRESLSFLQRAEGSFDTVLMLAVIHHLLLSAQIPMEEIASLVSRITTKNLILEWVPPADEKFVEVLRGREAIYTHITEELFRRSFGAFFQVKQEKLLENNRILFHMVKL